MSDFITELRENWNNSYWWLDHQALRVALITLVSGAVSLGLYYLRLRMERSMGVGVFDAES